MPEKRKQQEDGAPSTASPVAPSSRNSKKMKGGGPTAGPPSSLARYQHVKNNVLQRVLAHQDAWLLYEGEHTFAMLEGRPMSRGHVLIILKEAAATLLEPISDAGLLAMARDVQTVARAVYHVTQCAGLKVQQFNGPAAGQTIPQLHTHVVPCYNTTSSTTSGGCTGNGTAAAAAASSSSHAEEAARSETLGLRSEILDEEAGPLTAALRNRLPADYAPGFHYWAPSADHMEALGHVIQSHLCRPGHVVLLNGQLGAGKSTIARGVVRSYVGDPQLDVPSPTFLLCLTYEDDLAHEQGAADKGVRPARMHHMDPYRLGKASDRLSGLLDFNTAMAEDVCLIEWPDRMPAGVMALATKGVSIHIRGYGSQGQGRLVTITALPEDTTALATLTQWRTSGLPAPAPSWRSAPAAPRTLSCGAAGGAAAAAGRVAGLPADPAQWLVLGIESSCDDTAVAVVRGDGTVLAHEIASQAGMHEEFGGVKPDVARDAHAASITGTVDRCMAAAGLGPEQLTAVAVTIGPGLSLCLQVGVRHALTLAAAHVKPVIPVHHMEAHALMARMPGVNPQPLTFPALLLLVSGGHNMLVLCSGVGKFRIIGTTLDDSVGECFDKTARLLGFSAVPGGPLLERLALKGDPKAHKITIPMQNGQHKDSCNFSFSGLKTSVTILVSSVKAKLGLAHHTITLQHDAETGDITCQAVLTPPPPTPAAAAATAASGSQPVQQQQQQQQAVVDITAQGVQGSVGAGVNGALQLQGEGIQAAGLQHPGQGPQQGAGQQGQEQQEAGQQGQEQQGAAQQGRQQGQGQGQGAQQQGMETAQQGQQQQGQEYGLQDGQGVGKGGDEGVGEGVSESVSASEELCRTYVKAAADIAASYTHVAVRFLQQRTARALQWLQDDAAQQGGEPLTCLVVAGGVAANLAIRTGLQEVAAQFNLPCVCPPVKYCTDNGLMVAWAGVERLKLGLCEPPPAPDKVESNVQVLPRWPLGPLDPRSVLGSSVCKMYQ